MALNHPAYWAWVWGQHGGPCLALKPGQAQHSFQLIHKSICPISITDCGPENPYGEAYNFDENLKNIKWLKLRPDDKSLMHFQARDWSMHFWTPNPSMHFWALGGPNSSMHFWNQIHRCTFEILGFKIHRCTFETKSIDALLKSWGSKFIDALLKPNPSMHFWNLGVQNSSMHFWNQIHRCTFEILGFKIHRCTFETKSIDALLKSWGSKFIDALLFFWGWKSTSSMYLEAPGALMKVKLNRSPGPHFVHWRNFWFFNLSSMYLEAPGALTLNAMGMSHWCNLMSPNMGINHVPPMTRESMHLEAPDTLMNF